MAPIRRQRKSSNTKQRSFHLTDDVYAIVEREAAAQGISNSAWVSNIIQWSGDDGSVPIAAEHPRTVLPEGSTKPAPAPKPAKAARGIVLPDENVGEFVVDRARKSVQGKRLRSDNELSGVEGGAPQRRGRSNRNEEIEL
jgi:hypothetical protein